MLMIKLLIAAFIDSVSDRLLRRIVLNTGGASKCHTCKHVGFIEPRHVKYFSCGIASEGKFNRPKDTCRDWEEALWRKDRRRGHFRQIFSILGW